LLELTLEHLVLLVLAADSTETLHVREHEDVAISIDLRGKLLALLRVVSSVFSRDPLGLRAERSVPIDVELVVESVALDAFREALPLLR
jgi:hypothetical protein